jgi:2-keto-4-pentenoate hydratase/2-oxohepta-3-ene-1,7-dioic acid hydratase in catechol pathway
MKLCRFDEDRLGVVIGDAVHDVTEAQMQIRAAARYDMKGDAVIAALPAWRQRLEEMAAKARAIPLSQVKLISPVARPSKAMAAPTNYGKHIEEMAARRDIPDSAKRPSSKIGQAGIFLKSNSAIVGPSEGIPIRFPERLNEHEVELVIVIGREGSDIPRDKAKDYIGGYTLGLDMTVRGPEDRSFRKSIDGYAVLGPWMVTADEIPDPDDVMVTLHLNHELKQTADTKDLIYDIGRLIEFASSFYTLYPGDVYYTGTPAGVSPVKPGDVIRVSSASIGEFDIKVRAHRVGG